MNLAQRGPEVHEFHEEIEEVHESYKEIAVHEFYEEFLESNKHMPVAIQDFMNFMNSFPLSS